MKYEVIWLYDALDQLAAIWNDAPDQDAVTAASYRVDQRLATNPAVEGESRTGTERITFEPPLCILFRVFESEKSVEVATVTFINRTS